MKMFTTPTSNIDNFVVKNPTKVMEKGTIVSLMPYCLKKAYSLMQKVTKPTVDRRLSSMDLISSIDVNLLRMRPKY